MAGAWAPEYVNWLVNQQQMPSTPSYDKDILKEQGSWMTQASKGGNLTTDLDFLIANDMLAPGAYDRSPP